MHSQNQRQHSTRGCLFGQALENPHSITQPQQRQQEWRNKRVCLDHLKGICQEKRWKCKYAHPPLQLVTKSQNDASVCEVWMLTGTCKFGSSCRDYHPELPNSAPCAPAKTEGRYGHARQDSWCGSETGLSSSSSDESSAPCPPPPPRPTTRQEYSLDQVVRKVNGILNKLTYEKFDSLLRQLFELVAADNSEAYLERVLPLVFAKAISEHQISSLYATLIRHLYGLVGAQEKPVFLRQLMQLCDRLIYETADIVDALSAEQLVKFQEKRLGNVQLLAQLNLEGVVPLEDVLPRLMHLTERMGYLTSEGAFSIQLVCRLLTVMGASLKNSITSPIVQQMVSISSGHSQRVQFMVKDLVDFHSNGWTLQPTPIDMLGSPATPPTPLSLPDPIPTFRVVYVHNPYGFGEIEYRVPPPRAEHAAL